MTHWADDQVLVELQRNSADGMTRDALMQRVGIGPMDFDECVEGLREDGLARQEGFRLFWAGDDPPGAEENGNGKDPEPAAKPESVEGEAKSPPVTLGADAAVLSLLEQARKGEPIIMRAVVELRSNKDGELELEAVERVLEVKLEDS